MANQNIIAFDCSQPYMTRTYLMPQTAKQQTPPLLAVIVIHPTSDLGP